MAYMGIVRSITDAKCPKCGTVYLPEELVRDTVRKAEEIIEQKEPKSVG